MTIVTTLPAATFDNALKTVKEWDGDLATIASVTAAINWVTESYQCGGLHLSSAEREEFGFSLSCAVTNLSETVSDYHVDDEALMRKSPLEQLYDALTRTGYRVIGGGDDSSRLVIDSFTRLTQVRGADWDFKDQPIAYLEKSDAQRDARYATKLGGYMRLVQQDDYDSVAEIIGSRTLLWHFYDIAQNNDFSQWLQLDREGGVRVSVGPESLWFEDKLHPQNLVLDNVQISPYFIAGEGEVPDWVWNIRQTNYTCTRLVIDTMTGCVLEVESLKPLP